MYRCGNKVEIGDCITINVEIDVQEMLVKQGTVGMVLETNEQWGGFQSPLLTVKLPDDSIQQIPATWCILCERK